MSPRTPDLDAPEREMGRERNAGEGVVGAEEEFKANLRQNLGYRVSPITADNLWQTVARLVREAVEEAVAERLAGVEAVLRCGERGLRHYYAIDSTCQRCGMPSWVESRLRAVLHPEEKP